MGLKAMKYNKDNVVIHTTKVASSYKNQSTGEIVPVPAGTETIYVYDEISAEGQRVDAYKAIAKNDDVIVFWEPEDEPAADATE